MRDSTFGIYKSRVYRRPNKDGLRWSTVSSNRGDVVKFFSRNRSAIIMGLAALVIAGTADLFAGMLLNSMEEYLLLIPGMMVLVYSAIGMRGNIFGAMGSRIGTSMNIGTFEMSLKRGTVLRANMDSALALTLVMSVAMGIATWAVALAFFDGGANLLWPLIFISTIGGILAGLVVLCFNVLIAWIGNRREWDVDNITAPLIAAMGDIVTMPMIFAATWAYLEIDKHDFSDLAMMLMSLAAIAAMIAYVASVVFRRYARRDFAGEARRILVQSLPVLMFCLMFEIGAGMVIQDEQDRFVDYAVLMVMMPAFLNQGNALSGMLTSRLSSRIHLGTLKPRRTPQGEAYESFAVITVCALLTFVYIGAVSFAAAAASGDAGTSLAVTMASIVGAGAMATLVICVLSYYVAIATTRFGLDPDDHSIPITSSVMDLLGAVILVTVIGVLL